MVEALVLGIVLGGIIALGAVGLSLFYAILRFGHFAHGDLMTLGAYLALAMLAGPLAWLGLPDVPLRPLSIGPGLILATALAAAIITLLVWLLDAGVYAPMRRRGSDVTLIAFASLAIAIIVRSVIYILWGPQPLRYSVELQQAIPLPLGARIKPDELFSLAVVGVIVVALYLFLERTKIGRAMRATADNPELAALKGKTIITTDGTTLLGADDKAGVAVIMETAAYLMAHPEVPHGPIRICFTCDEEIGRGVDHLELKKLGAHVAYTLDGGGTGEIDGETFSADLAVVTITGVNVHPGIAKGRMVNAVRLAGLLLDRLPRQALTPETTADREGFLHPYRIEGGVAEVVLRVLLRDFETPRLAEKAELLRAAAQLLEAEFPPARIMVQITPQYRNMAEGLAREPRALAFAEEAMRRVGLEPRRTIVRGGTDGSRLTEMGLPTPNLSCGEHNLHSPLEWTCLEEMETAVRVLVELARVWGESG